MHGREHPFPSSCFAASGSCLLLKREAEEMRCCGICRVTVFVILDIDGTLLSACRRFSAAYPFTIDGAIKPQQTLRYHDVERGRMVQNCVITMRPYLGEFLQAVSGRAMNTSRVAVQLGLFTRNTSSYAHAVAEQVLRPLISVPFAFIIGNMHRNCRHRRSCCCYYHNDDNNNDDDDDGGGGKWKRRRKSLAVSGSPSTSLLIDDSCSSFIAEEFFSGRGALVEPFFTGTRPWGPEEELDDVLSCNSCSIHEGGGSFPPWDGADVSLCALIKEFVAFWHDNDGSGGSSSTMSSNAANHTLNLLTDPRAVRYKELWLRYHAPMDEQLQCIMSDLII